MNIPNKSLLIAILLIAPHSYTKSSPDEEIFLKEKNKIKGSAISGKLDREARDAAERKEEKQRVTIEQTKKKRFFVKEFSEEEKILLTESFANAPARLKLIIEDMANGEEYTQDIKNILLTGPTGTGKTTLAQAIAYKLKRKCLIIEAPILLSHYRDQASEHLNQLFQELCDFKEKPVLIINEMNVLTDNHTSEHSDTKNTATQLWCKLDELSNSKDFLFIGTTNVTKKMPHQLQSRLRESLYFIDNPAPEYRKKMIKSCAAKRNFQIDESCSDDYLNSLAERTANFSYRDIKSLVTRAMTLYRLENQNSSIKKITSKSLDQAYSDIKQETEQFLDFTDREKDEERRHREIMKQNEKHYEDNKELQLKLAELHMLFQALLTTKTSGNHTPGIDQTIEQFHKAISIVFPERKLQGKVISKDGFFFSYNELVK